MNRRHVTRRGVTEYESNTEEMDGGHVRRKQVERDTHTKTERLRRDRETDAGNTVRDGRHVSISVLLCQ